MSLEPTQEIDFGTSRDEVSTDYEPHQEEMFGQKLAFYGGCGWPTGWQKSVNNNSPKTAQ